MTEEATASTKMRKASLIAALCSGLAPLAALAQPAPTLISGTVDSEIVHIGAVPVAPKVTLDLRGDTEEVYLTFTGPGGQLFEEYFYNVSEPNGKSIFDGAGITNTFSPYAAAGTWTLTTVYACTYSKCNYYTGATLSPLFPSLTFTVVNPHSDTTPPTINSAVITTPTVATTNDAKIEVEVHIHDDISGVSSARVMFSNGSNTFDIGGEFSHTIKSPAIYKLIFHCKCANVSPGTYTAASIVLGDAADNTTSITDAGQISTLFGGQPTFTITN